MSPEGQFLVSLDRAGRQGTSRGLAGKSLPSPGKDILVFTGADVFQDQEAIALWPGARDVRVDGASRSYSGIGFPVSRGRASGGCFSQAETVFSRFPTMPSGTMQSFQVTRYLRPRTAGHESPSEA